MFDACTMNPDRVYAPAAYTNQQHATDRQTAHRMHRKANVRTESVRGRHRRPEAEAQHKREKLTADQKRKMRGKRICSSSIQWFSVCAPGLVWFSFISMPLVFRHIGVCVCVCVSGSLVSHNVVVCTCCCCFIGFKLKTETEQGGKRRRTHIKQRLKAEAKVLSIIYRK